MIFLNKILKTTWSIFLIILITFLFTLIIDFFFGKKILELTDRFWLKTEFYGKIKRIDHDVYHHGLKANVKMKNVKGFEDFYTFCTDNHGFRYKCDFQKRGKYFDYAFMGDSFTEGSSVSYEDSFVGIFEKISKKNVVNLGVVSYAPKIYLSKINYYLNDGYNFDHVIIPIDISDLYDDNVSYRLDSNYFVKDNSKFKLAIKYEYLTQFDVSAGFEARTVDNYFYFEDRTLTGFFDTYKEDDVKIVTLFLNSNLLTNRFGNFFADLRIQDARASFNNVIPYEPGFVFTAAYNYNFNFGLNATLRYKFSSEAYSDIQNSVKLPYLNSLDLFVKYELFTNFYTFAELNNIINNKNYYWKLYQEKTFDVLLGIEYQF